MCKIFVLTLLWLPVFFTNPVSQNITALQQHCLWLYILWGLLVLTLLVRRYRPGPWLVCLVAGFVIPWNAAGPGWLNDLHIWLQIAAIILLSVEQLRLVLYVHNKKARTWFLVLGISFVIMAACGHVSGLAEMVWASGILLLVPARPDLNSPHDSSY
ncbi:hypothetical protein [Faecalibaculum rodentium]|uniref:hypothetical protein n=1 Tax=Faecalibaculum rodentium TaxID=1702221 RepID=UPI002604D240|nr:hypothetical protein [Faecalibaculum rodentium]